MSVLNCYYTIPHLVSIAQVFSEWGRTGIYKVTKITIPVSISEHIACQCTGEQLLGANTELLLNRKADEKVAAVPVTD